MGRDHKGSKSSLPDAGRRGIRLLTWAALIACAAVLIRMGMAARSSRDLGTATIRQSAELLQSDSSSDRITAVQDLGRFGTEAPSVAVPALVGALGDEAADVRAAAAESLAGFTTDNSSPEAATALLRSLKDREASVRVAAAGALGAIYCVRQGRGLRPAVDPHAVIAGLAGALDDQDDRVREAVAVALGLVGSTAAEAPPEVLIAALEDPSNVTRDATAAALTHYTRGLDPVVPLLLRGLERSSIRRNGLTWKEIRPPAISGAVVPDLIAAFESRNHEVRWNAIQMAGSLGADGEAAIPALMKLLDQSGPLATPNPLDSQVYQAVLALGELAPGTSRAEDAIACLERVLRGPDPEGRNGAANALGKFGPAAQAAIPALIVALKANAEVPRIASDTIANRLAELAVGTLRADEAVAALTGNLDATLPTTRAGAIHALARFGKDASPAVSRLQTLQRDDPSEWVRSIAAEALDELSEP